MYNTLIGLRNHYCALETNGLILINLDLCFIIFNESLLVGFQENNQVSFLCIMLIDE